jgi:transposase-like protein
MTSNEVHFDIPLTPIEDLALSRGCRIRQVRSNSRLDQMTPAPWSIALWVKQADRDAGSGDGGLTTSEREELRQLRREREILAKAAAWFAQETTPNAKGSSNS